MDIARFEQLVNGEIPSLGDFAGFVSVVEKLPIELLWPLAAKSPSLNHTLRAVLDKRLAELVQRTNVDNALNGIAERLMAMSKNGGTE